MSCIMKLLEIKDNPEVMDKCVSSGVIMEGGGEYKGFEYLITFTDLGHRCGYVAIDPFHRLYCKYEEAEELEVHGGVTFHSVAHHLKDHLKNPCADQWIGFDMAHYMDKNCPDTVQQYFGKKCIRECSELGTSHKDYSYVENECKKLIDQLA